MHIGVCVVPERVASALTSDPLTLHYRVTTEQNVVAVSPTDEMDIAQSTPCHRYFPDRHDQLDSVYEELVHPVVTQVTHGQSAQGCIVVDGPQLAKYHVLLDPAAGLLRRLFAELAATSFEFDVGLAEIDVGDSLVDVLEPRAAHPPTIVDDPTLARTILHGLKLLDGRVEETQSLIERLHNPNRHQVVAFGLKSQPAASAPCDSWIYVIGLAVRERFRGAGSRVPHDFLGANTNGPFRAALQSVTAAVAAPRRPATIPFSHSKLTHLLKPCLCDELQPAAWIVALCPYATAKESAYKDACVAMASVQRVASTCLQTTFPRDVDDAPPPPKGQQQQQQQQRSGTSRGTVPARSSNATAAPKPQVTTLSSSTSPAVAAPPPAPIPLVDRQRHDTPSSTRSSSVASSKPVTPTTAATVPETSSSRNSRPTADRGAALNTTGVRGHSVRASEQDTVTPAVTTAATSGKTNDKTPTVAKAKPTPEVATAIITSSTTSSAASRVSQEFAAYREAMEPALRRLRQDADRRAQLNVELERQLRTSERNAKKLEGEVAILQRELRTVTARSEETVRQLETAWERVDLLETEIANVPVVPTRPHRSHVNTQTSMTAFDIETIESAAQVQGTQDRLLQNRLRELENELRQARQESVQQRALASETTERVRSLERELRLAREFEEMRPPPVAAPVPIPKSSAAVQVGFTREAEVEEVAALSRRPRPAELTPVVSAAPLSTVPTPAFPAAAGHHTPERTNRHLRGETPRASSVASAGSGRGIVGNFRFTDEEFRRVEEAVRNRGGASTAARS